MKTSLKAMSCVALLVLNFLIVGCSSSSGTLSREPVSYLRISGLSAGLSATVDNLPPVALPDQSKPISLQVSPGKHHIRITHDQTVLVDRMILVSDLQTLEISVP